MDTGGRAAGPRDVPRSAGRVAEPMSATLREFGALRFSSAQLRPGERVPFYRDVVSRTLAQFDVESVGENFSFEARIHRAPDLSVAWISEGDAVRIRRTREMAAAGRQKLVLMVNLEGAATYSQRGREASVSPGSAVLLSGSEACRMERSASRFLLVCVPRALLTPMLLNPDAMLMSVVPHTTEALRLLTAYLHLLARDPALVATPELRRLAAHHVHDLVALAVGATHDANEIAARRGLRAARLRAIKADIDQNLAGDVTVAALSARHRLSPRYIRKLFEGEDASLSQFVLGERLTRVYRMLADPRYADSTISGIVFAVGFGDLSTFNREFRRRFGLTPSDVRAGRQARTGA
jgi:AraC-like DNA-binding protein